LTLLKKSVNKLLFLINLSQTIENTESVCLWLCLWNSNKKLFREIKPNEYKQFRPACRQIGKTNEETNK